MGKKYESVKGMLNNISSDEEFKKAAAKEIEDRMIAKFLFVLRSKQKFTQKMMAKKIGCSQGKISKVESAYDKDISIGDLLNYASALGLHLEIGFRRPSVKIVDLIKYHALKIKMYLNQLTDLAKSDEAMENGIVDFHLEAQENISRFISGNLSKLKESVKKHKNEKSKIHISAPMESAKKNEESDLISAA